MNNNFLTKQYKNSKKFKINHNYLKKQFFNSKEIFKNINLLLRRTDFTLGKDVDVFEKNFAKLIGTSFAIGVGSGTDALFLSLKALSNKNKSEVIVPSFTFYATIGAIVTAGFKPIFVDINPKTIAFDIHDLKNKIIKYKPDIVMPVHIGGCSYNYEYIKDLSLKYNFKIIEDAAHSFGGKYNNKFKIGSCKFSDLTVFSFHPVKTITTGEGGVITTNNKEYYLKLLRLRSHGINKLDDNFLIKKQAYTNGKKNQWYYEMRELGYHYRITDIQCALGISQLNKLPDVLKKRK
jgi:dTDP-4-amino-4,6-dideoxygalactose transaminase